jgi:signal transduction histidine kinase
LWAKQNLDTALGVYKLNAIWVYKTNHALAYSVNDFGDDEFNEAPLPKDELRRLFLKKKFVHFFVETPKGIMEIHGATIHPTYDRFRMSPPQGYVLGGRIWDREYLRELGSLIGGRVEIVRQIPAEPVLNSHAFKGGDVIFSKELKSANGSILSHVRVREVSQAIQVFRVYSGKMYLILIVATGLFLAALSMYLTFLLVRPLQMISSSLIYANTSPLAGLRKKKDEFGEISRLIETFFNQKEQLIKETKERLLTEEKLKSKIAILEMFNKAAMEREKRMTDLKKQLKEFQLKANDEALCTEEKLSFLSEIIPKMAHEINNPLMVISGNAQLALMEIQDKALQKNIHAIAEQAERIREIMHKLLIFSRPSRHEVKDSNVNLLIEAALSLISGQYNLSNIKVVQEFDANLPLLPLDETQMKEVFTHVIRNAIDAMPEGGMVILNTANLGDKVQVSIQDTGHGIPRESISRVFEPFFTTKDNARGMSLAISYGIVKAHRGEIRLESQLGRGTTVTILLPLG